MADKEPTTSYHRPVMVDEVLGYLNVDQCDILVDATIGGGGHTSAILEASSEVRVIGFDRDPEAVGHCRERFEKTERVEIFRSNYSNVGTILKEQGIEEVDAILVDAGLSSAQLDDDKRGFSYRVDAPLDMRMGPEAMSAKTYLERTDAESLSRDLREYGDVRSANKIAEEIKRKNSTGEMETTHDLTDAVDAAVEATSASSRLYTLVFQAVRMAINRELASLEKLLKTFPDFVRSGGRGVFISFHSGEDRLVKHTLRDLARDCVCPPELPICGCDKEKRIRLLTKGPVRPASEEVRSNPRASSAKLRAGEVV